MVVTFEVEVDCYEEKNKEQVEEIKELKKKVRKPRLEQSLGFEVLRHSL